MQIELKTVWKVGDAQGAKYDYYRRKKSFLVDFQLVSSIRAQDADRFEVSIFLLGELSHAFRTKQGP